MGKVNLSVTSSLQSDRIQDARSFGDLVAENNRLVQENDALKQRIAELQAAEAGGAGGAAGGGAGGGGAGEVPAAAVDHSHPWSQCSREWKRRRTEGIASEIDKVAENHQTTAITVAAHMLRRKARVTSKTDIWLIAQFFLLFLSHFVTLGNHDMGENPTWSQRYPKLTLCWSCNVRGLKYLFWFDDPLIRKRVSSELGKLTTKLTYLSTYKEKG